MAELRGRFQQIAAALMAKGQEDMALYRYTCLISANKVGADPAQPSITARQFHQRMCRRVQNGNSSLSLTSSHDTKRSEDTRMRVVALTYHPDVAQFLMDTACSIPGSKGCVIPAALRWYLVQSLWASHPGERDPEGLAKRLCDHAVKGMREAQVETAWRNPNREFEAGVMDSINRLVQLLGVLPDATYEAACTGQ